MSKPTKKELDTLRGLEGDSEAYHGAFDKLLGLKLLEIDPEWILEMNKVYEKSGARRWCA